MSEKIDPTVLQRTEGSESTQSEPEIEHKFGAWNIFLSKVRWYPEGMPAIEKSLVLRLDLMILIFGGLSFFTKYLNQAAITNAYISGMKEDLNLHGNELSYMNIVFWSSYCTLMIPFCYIITRIPINIALPNMELLWGLFTFGCAWAKNVETIYALRFFVGAAETISFTGVIYVAGSWYKPREIARRVAFFFTASPLGTMFAGYLQAAAYKDLNGTHGLVGWRWLFIICAVITLPICFLGYFVFPDVPHRSKPRFLTTTQHSLARSRLVGLTAPAELEISKTIFKRVFGGWHWYSFVLHWTLLNQGVIISGQLFSLYLKAKSKIYSVTQINTLPTISTAVSVVAALFAGLYADRTGRFWVPCIFASGGLLIGAILLAVWKVVKREEFLRLSLRGRMVVSLSPMCISWATTLMSNDAEERAIVTASMNAIGQAMIAWSQIFEYPAIQAPNFHTGFIVTACMGVGQLINFSSIWFLARRELRARAKTAGNVDEKEGERVEGSKEI